MNWLRRFTWSEDWSLSSEPPLHVVVQRDDSLISILAAKDRNTRELAQGRDPSRRVVFHLEEEAATDDPSLEPRRTMARGPRSRTTSYRNCLLQYQQMCSAHETTPLQAVVQGLQAAIEGHQERQQQLVVTDIALDSEAAVWCLCDCLALWSDLQSVTLQSCALRDGHLRDVCAALAQRRCLKYLNLAGNPRISSGGLSAIAGLIQRSSLLHYLNLSGIALSVRMAETLARAIATRTCLRSVILHECGLHTLAVLHPLCQTLAASESIVNISFKSNQLSPQAATSLKLLLQRPFETQCLDLRNNLLADDGAVELAEALVDPHCRLAKLVLLENHIGARGALALASALGRTTLEAADLSNNDFGSPIVLAALKHGLCSNLRMKNLYLWGCRIKSEGAVLLAELIAENKCLERMELRGNFIGLPGLIALSATTACNKTLFKCLVDMPSGLPAADEEEVKLYYDMIQAHCTANLPPPPLTSISRRAKDTTTQEGRGPSPSSSSSSEGDDTPGGPLGTTAAGDSAVACVPPTEEPSEDQGVVGFDRTASPPNHSAILSGGEDGEDGGGDGEDGEDDEPRAAIGANSGLLVLSEPPASPSASAEDELPTSDPDPHHQLNGTGPSSSEA